MGGANTPCTVSPHDATQWGWNLGQRKQVRGMSPGPRALQTGDPRCAAPAHHLSSAAPSHPPTWASSFLQPPHPHLSLQLVPSTHQAPTQPQPSPLGPPSKASAMEAQVSGPQDWPPWQSRHSPLEKSPQTEGLSWQNLMGSSARARVMLYHHSPTQHHTTGSGLGLGGEK